MQDPFKITGAVLVGMGDGIRCGIFSCEPIPPEGMVLSSVAVDVQDGPLVAIDVDVTGRVYAAHSGRMENSILDNRAFDEAGLDEELALDSVQDRLEMIERAVANGKYEEDFFTSTADRLVVFEDRRGDGLLETRTDSFEFNAPESGIASGVLVQEDDVYFTNIPDVWRFHDLDDAGLPREKEVLSTGWGPRFAFYGHDMHGLILGPDGKIYFTIGDRGFNVKTKEGRTLRPDIDVGRGAVLRMNPDGSELEVFAQGLRNPQELAFDDYGNLFTADNNSDSDDKARLVYVVEGGDSGWMMPYQLLRAEDYERGPWNAERLWHPEHDGQPAWIVPPVGLVSDGPAGFAYVPGLGVPERFREHFLLADYKYLPSQSAILAFTVSPDGAGFRLDEPTVFVDEVLATDMAFGADGSTYVSWFRQLPSHDGGLYRLELTGDDAAAQADELRAMERLLREGMTERGTDELSDLLGFPDRRVRMPAQFELVRRDDARTLGAVARDRAAPLLARLHAVWGLGQLGARGLRRAGWKDLDWAAGDDPEVRAQVVRVVGTAQEERLAANLVPFLRDESPRVRYFAAQSIGALRYGPAVPDLIELLRENADQDVYLRHAASVALARMGSPDALLVYAHDESPAVRMGVLLALRRQADRRVATFLSDSDPRLVVEAARAIYDLPIERAMPALASLDDLPDRAGDSQGTHALDRRVIAANVRLGTPAAADRIAAYAADGRNPEEMRLLALDALGGFVAPSPRDPVLGSWEPMEERDVSVVYTAIDRHVPELMDTSLEGAALEVAEAYDRVPLDDDELLERVADTNASSRTRTASLRALGARSAALAPGALDDAVAVAISSDDPALRAEARDVLAKEDPGAAIASIDALPSDAAPIERQRAYGTLAVIGTEQSDARLAAGLERLARGTLPSDVQLDVVEASRARDTEELRGALDRYEQGLDAGDPVAPYRIAAFGGSAARGAEVFTGNGDCKRCHASGGHGGDTGPALDGLASRYDREEILEAIIVPEATIASGYEQQVGGSAMPPIAVELPMPELRDLMAYLATLR